MSISYIKKLLESLHFYKKVHGEASGWVYCLWDILHIRYHTFFTPLYIYNRPIIHRKYLTHLPLDKMAAILQTMFSDAFSWMKNCISIKISLKVVIKGPIGNNPASVWIMAWRRLGDKPLSEPIPTRFNDAYITRGRWVNDTNPVCAYHWYTYCSGNEHWSQIMDQQRI